jgi:M6 family metalloprotease-like protein
VALLAVDFPDQPFVITLPKHSDLFGNPQIDPVAREKVPQFYADFYNKPSALNHGHGFKADGRMEPDADALWAKDAGDIKKNYDIVLRIYAGYDETSVWQEFGEMKFQTKEDIPAEWGNPDPAMPRWVVTRYVPWTPWKVGQMQWGLSSVRQGESSGTLTHEIVHFAFRVGDNNNNPYVEPYRRAGSGPWDIMDRGSFNGPGGPHRRWVVPAAEGASMPAGLMLRSKVRFNFLKDAIVLKLTRSGIAKSGPVVATVTARAVDPGPNGLAGITVALDGDGPQDRTPPDDMNRNPLSSGRTDWNFYSIEVVQRIGYDSFTPDNGVLLAKNKNEEDRGGSCGANYNCFTWVIDAHPEDIRMLDFKRPHGEPVMRTVADYRQLNDALFHAGLSSGSQYEWEDAPNRLHFYVVDRNKDDRGVLSYVVGVRSLDDASPLARGVALAADAGCAFTLTNTGAGADIFRLSVVGAGQIQNALAALQPGASQSVRVYAASGGATLRAASETDPAKSASAACR